MNEHTTGWTGGRNVWIAAGCLLVLISIAYLARGFIIYCRGPGDGPVPTKVGQMDVRRRWVEQQYIFAGINPYDVAFAHSLPAQPFAPLGQADVRRDAKVIPDLGVPEGVVYPPWAYFSASLLFWMPLSLLIPTYTLLMTGALCFIAIWAFNLGRNRGRCVGITLALLSIALASWVGAIFLGNYPTLIVGCLVAALWLEDSKHPLAAAMMLAFALLKPTVAGPFIIVLLVKKRFISVTLMATYLIVATVVVCFHVHTPPLEMIRQMFAASRQFVNVGSGPTQYLIRAGMDPVAATRITGVVFLALGALAMGLARRASLLTLFGIAAVTARLWSYHLYYDDNVLLFLLMALAIRMLEARSTKFMVGFLACAVSLVAPGRTTDYIAFQIFQQGTWIICAILLVLDARRSNMDSQRLLLNSSPSSRE